MQLEAYLFAGVVELHENVLDLVAPLQLTGLDVLRSVVEVDELCDSVLLKAIT